MTRTANAGIAGFAFLAYIAATIASMVIFGRTAGDGSTAERLATISTHATGMHIVILLAIVQAFSALALAVTLYAVTRDQDRDLALFAMACRLIEGVMCGISASANMALLWVATTSSSDASAMSAARLLGEYLLRDDSAVPALFFAVGSALFAYLLLRGRMIPVALAWLGVVASILLVVALPAQLADLVTPSLVSFLWLPMLVFEILLGLWLLIKGINPSRPRAA
jgi:surface polysaccharide O-acyltransferase-like enzyme